MRNASLILITLALATVFLNSCGDVSLKSCKPISLCAPPCVGGGLECTWTFNLHRAIPIAPGHRFPRVLATDRVIVAFVCSPGVTYKEPKLVYGGVNVASEPFDDP